MKNATTIKAGDHVQLSDGKYAGCILTLLRIDRGWHVCKRSDWPYEVRSRKVKLFCRMPENERVPVRGGVIRKTKSGREIEMFFCRSLGGYVTIPE